MGIFENKQKREATKIQKMTVVILSLIEKQHAEWKKSKKDYDCNDLIAGVKFDVPITVINNIITWEAKSIAYQWKYIPRKGNKPAYLIEYL